MPTPVLAPPGIFMSTVSANDSNVEAARRALIVTLMGSDVDMVVLKSENIAVWGHVTRLYARESVLLL